MYKNVLIINSLDLSSFISKPWAMGLFQAVKTDTGQFWTTEILLNTIAVTFRSTGCQGKFISFPPLASLHEVSSLGYFLTFLIIFSFTFSNHNFMQLHVGLWILQTLLNYRDIIYSLTQIIYSSVITEIKHLYSTYDMPPTDLRTLLVLVYVILPAPLEVCITVFLILQVWQPCTERLVSHPALHSEKWWSSAWIRESGPKVHALPLLCCLTRAAFGPAAWSYILKSACFFGITFYLQFLVLLFQDT